MEEYEPAHMHARTHARTHTHTHTHRNTDAGVAPTISSATSQCVVSLLTSHESHVGSIVLVRDPLKKYAAICLCINANLYCSSIWTNQTHNFSLDSTNQLVIRLTNNHKPLTQYTYWVPVCL